MRRRHRRETRLTPPLPRTATHDYLRERGLLDKGGLLGQLGDTLTNNVDGIITGVEGALGDVVNGLTGALATGVKESDRRPDADHPYMEPGPTDQRGPCPGLNTLAVRHAPFRRAVVSCSLEPTLTFSTFAEPRLPPSQRHCHGRADHAGDV